MEISKADGESPRKKKILEMGQNSEKELDRMSKQTGSGDEQNLELSESLRAAIEKSCRQQTATSRSFWEKSIEDDSPKRARSSGCLNLLQETTLIEPEVPVLPKSGCRRSC
jgi:hypothetical protein